MRQPNPSLLARSALIAAAMTAAAMTATPAWSAACTVKVDHDVPARMRDGTTLLADVYRPNEAGTYPVLLMRLPYNKSDAQAFVYARPEAYASHCYIVAIQDVRGQYKSEGTFYPFRNEGADGYDSVEWAAALPGSSGKVGMYGFSYVGATQWLAAAERPPHLVAIAPAQTGSDYFNGWTYEGGALSQAFVQSWPLTSVALSASRRLGNQQALNDIQAAAGRLSSVYAQSPLSRLLPASQYEDTVAPYYGDWITHNTWDAYWKPWSIRARYDQVAVPALNLAGWYDVFLRGGVENYSGMRERGGSDAARSGQRLVIGPWSHMPWLQKVGELDFGAEASNPIDALLLRWFDHWLKGEANGLDADKPVRIFVMGANRWREADSWPPAEAKTVSFYLQSRGQANTRFGNGSLTAEKPEEQFQQKCAAVLRPELCENKEPERFRVSVKNGNALAEQAADQYRYDPADPVPSAGGHSCCSPDSAPIGPMDQANIEDRADVLYYATPPLEQDMEVTGPVTVELYASSSAVDTDFTAKLVDVHPDGKAYNLANGIIRASMRETLERRTPIEPGKVTKYTIDLGPTSSLFQRGHRIALEISSSNFPHYDRNPNNGKLDGTGAPVVAEQRVLHDTANPSRLLLSVMPKPISAAP
ncbi:MAG: CocE/NonD family hydrolase [Aquamicrobium sp.]|uniref:CocE/NonD family hydrolase n=1 Tax=Mesorhizobium sp. Pch-S TaxID=2082387 RepID=UPI0010120280|nr:CocE/NonD family hydrolase [Mesorhizobium sp. Pch-S]MBR2690384.1 CocE/NonD family hydrolase [Aquamicrobium sp.]QAZ42559.1 peptidase [Mesorhizobium sp. Pch-S]